ncbi:MAG: hypothetical protein KC464_11280 [Myxococcales bacterium]|nr:hypothetical protein [Myxococcales bacterium]MCB9508280.1 hypothetical protein [Myxococcales bacterium]
MTAPEPAPPLTYEQASRILAKLSDLEHPVVLVGGQALNFWANYYEARVAELAAGAPYMSKDIDFLGSHDAVSECARRLGGKAKLTTLDDMNTPNTGIVMFLDDDGHLRQIDFLGSLAGIPETYYESLDANILDANDATVAILRVMDPISCLKSRAHNVAYLPGYQTEHALNQLRAAILCAREFGRDLLAEDPFEALKCNEHVFGIARYGAGPFVYVRYGIDVLGAVVDDAGMPDAFYTERLPRVRANVERAREKLRAADARTEAFRARKNDAG